MAQTLIITDGRAGNLRQARALAEAVGWPSSEAETALRPPWRQLAPRWPHLAGLAGAAATRVPRSPPWPSLVIGCGRQAAWWTRWLRRRAGAATFAVQILDPRINPRHWDLVIAPEHDGLAGANVLRTVGSLNPVDTAWLATARAGFPALARLPAPRVALLLGGPRRGVVWDVRLRAALAATALRLAGTGGSVLLSASARTPPAFAAALRDALAARPGRVWLGAADGPNPWPGFMAWADRIIVTPDSVNMLSEAAACGVPVFSPVVGALPPRLAAFHDALRAGGWLRDAAADAGPPPEPLRETGACAEEVLRRIAARAAA